MILATTEQIYPYEIIETIGLVKGSTIMSKHIGQDILAGLQTIMGGEIEGYQDMLEEARKIAETRMVENANQLGADAIVSIRYASSSIMQGAAEMVVYGTAVKLAKKVSHE